MNDKWETITRSDDSEQSLRMVRQEALHPVTGSEAVANHRNQPEWSLTRRCALCGTLYLDSVHGAGGRPSRFCCNAHKQAAYRGRKAVLRNAGSNSKN